MSPETEAIIKAIRKRHSGYRTGPQGILFTEMATGTGYAHGEPNRLDVFHMEDVPSKRFHRTAYEIKVSRSDFLREMKQPLKRRAAMRISNNFYFVTPEGLLSPGEIPFDSGLLELRGNRLVVVVRAPHNDGLPPTWHFFASFARRIKKEQDRA